MKTLFELLQNKDIKELAKHPRHKALDFFYQKVNQDLVSAGYNPWSKKRLAIKISHLSEMDLDFLMKKVGQSSQPARMFFGSLKIVKKEAN